MPTKKEKKQTPERHLILSKIELAPDTQKVLFRETPREFVKTREGKGGRKFDYVEIGYVISQLNTIYGQLNWDFEVIDKARDGNEIWVQGKLTIIDHRNGFEVSKTQFGQCQLKDKQAVGDAYKSATSDCLKKCASMFGIAQDIYWQLLDESQGSQKADTTIPTAAEFERIKRSISKVNDPNVLRELLKKIPTSKVYALAQKKELTAIITKRLNNEQGEQKTIEV